MTAVHQISLVSISEDRPRNLRVNRTNMQQTGCKCGFSFIDLTKRLVMACASFQTQIIQVISA